MDARFTKNIIGIIRAERGRLEQELEEFWLDGEPLVNELCLMLLVAVWHQVEREIVRIAALRDGGAEFERDDYRRRVGEARERWWKKNKEMVAQLRLEEDFTDWNSSMAALKQLANSYKHDPLTTQGENDLMEALAASIDLKGSTDYCDIADKLVDCAARFIAEVKAAAPLSKVKGRPVSLFDIPD